MTEKLEKLLLEVQAKLRELENQLYTLIKLRETTEKLQTPFEHLEDIMGDCKESYTVEKNAK